MDIFGENLRKLILAGIGAASVSREKAEAVLDDLVKRGELTVEQGKVLNEELRHNVKQAVKDNVTVVTSATPEDLMNSVSSMNDEQLKELKKRIKTAETARAQQAQDGKDAERPGTAAEKRGDAPREDKK